MEKEGIVIVDKKGGERNMKLIAVDAGHGMDTAGKRTPAFPDGTIMKENEFNRATADYLVKALNRNGFKTILTAPDILDTPLQKRVQKARAYKSSRKSRNHQHRIPK